MSSAEGGSGPEPASPGFSKPHFEAAPGASASVALPATHAPAPPLPAPAAAASPAAPKLAFGTPAPAPSGPVPAPGGPPARSLPAAKAVSRAVPGRKRVFKVIIIGDAGVGKTCLSFRFCNGRFPERTEATIGVDFRERSVEIDGELLRVQLWDTAGQERFRQSMVAHYYRNVSAVVFVYDLGRQDSFTNLALWIKEAKSQVSDSELPMILIGNKCDVTEGARVATGEAQKFADSHDMPLFETSAKADSQADHVESIFMTLVHKLKDAKPMHVQTEKERGVQRDESGKLILRAADLERKEEEEEAGWCC